MVGEHGHTGAYVGAWGVGVDECTLRKRKRKTYLCQRMRGCSVACGCRLDADDCKGKRGEEKEKTYWM